MGLSSLAVMGNSLTLQLQGRPRLPDMTSAPDTAAVAQQRHMRSSGHSQQHHERQDTDAAAAASS